MIRKIFFSCVILGLLLNAVLDYRTYMETTFPNLFTENSQVYHTLSIIDICVLLILAVSFWKQWRENLKIESRMARTISDISTLNQKLRLRQDDQTKRFKNVVHDIKNPLGVIKGFAGLMKEESDDRASIAEMSQIVERVSNEAIMLVQNLLTAEPEKRERTQIDLGAKIAGVCDELGPVASQKNQIVEMNALGSDLKMVASPHDIDSVLHNLIGNAIKFSPHGGRVFVSAAKNVDGIYISVKDSGPGFSDEDMKSLFQMGRSLSARPTGDELSSGVGLSSVKKILDDYEAKIEIANLHPGAEITVQFPNNAGM